MNSLPAHLSDNREAPKLYPYSKHPHKRFPVRDASEHELRLGDGPFVEVDAGSEKIRLKDELGAVSLMNGISVVAAPVGDGRFQVDCCRNTPTPKTTYLYEFNSWHRIEYAPPNTLHQRGKPGQKNSTECEHEVTKLSIGENDVVEFFGSHRADLYDYGFSLERGGKVLLHSDEGTAPLPPDTAPTNPTLPHRYLTHQTDHEFQAQLNLLLQDYDRFGDKEAIWVYDKKHGWGEVRFVPEGQREPTPLWLKHQHFYAINLAQYHYTVQPLGTSVIVDRIKLSRWPLGDRIPIDPIELTESGQVSLLDEHNRLLHPGNVAKYEWGQIVVSSWGNTIQVDFLGYYWEQHFAWTVVHPGDEWKEVQYSGEQTSTDTPDGFGRFPFVTKRDPDHSLDRGDLANPVPRQLSNADYLRANELIARDFSRPLNFPAIRFAGVPLRESHVNQHFFFHGNIGSGKSVFMKELLLHVRERLDVDPRTRLLIHDPKGDFVTMLDDRFGSTAKSLYKVVNPFDARGAAWNMSKDLGVLSTRRFANMLFPENTHEPFWPKTSRVLFQAVVETFAKKAKSWGLRDVLTACLCCDSLDAVLQESAGGRRFKRLLNKTSGTKANIIQTLQAYLDDFVPLAMASEAPELQGHYFSVVDWVKRMPSEPPILIMTGSHQAADILAAYYRGLIRLAADKLLDGPEVDNPITWFFIDEAQMMADMTELGSIADKGRSKGLVLVLATMNALKFEQKAAATSEKHTGFLMGLGNKALLRCDSDLAVWSSKFFGKGWRTKANLTKGSTLNTGREGNTSTSSSETLTDHETDLVPPSAFSDLPSGSIEGGFHAFVKSDPDLNGGMWKDVLGGDGRQDPIPPAPRSDDHEKPEDELEYLSEWEPEDLHRLGLAPKPEPDLGPEDNEADIIIPDLDI